MATRRLKSESGGVGSVLEKQPEREEVSLSSFPNEILEMIIGNVTHYDSQVKLRLVNRRWKRLTDPYLRQSAFLPTWVPFSETRNLGNQEGVTSFNSGEDVEKFMEDMKDTDGSSMVERNPIPTRRILIEQNDDDYQSKVIKRSHDLNYVAIPKLFTKYWDTITRVYCCMDSVQVRCGEVARQLCTEVFKQLPNLVFLGLQGLRTDWVEDEEEEGLGRRHFEGSVPHFKYLRIRNVDDDSLCNSILMTYGQQLKSLEVSKSEGLMTCLEDEYNRKATRDKEQERVGLLPNLEELKLSNDVMDLTFEMVFGLRLPISWHLRKLSIQMGKYEGCPLHDLLIFIGKFSMTLEDLCVDIHHLIVANEVDNPVELLAFPVLTKLAISYCLKENDRVWEQMVDKMKSLKQLTFLCRRLNYETARTDIDFQWEEGYDDVRNAQAGISDIWIQFPLLQRVRLFQHNVGWERNAYHNFVNQVDRSKDIQYKAVTKINLGNYVE